MEEAKQQETQRVKPAMSWAPGDCPLSIIILDAGTAALKATGRTSICQTKVVNQHATSGFMHDSVVHGSTSLQLVSL